MTGLRATHLATMMAVLALAALTPSAPAEVVTLKSGEVFRGKIILQTDNDVQIETAPGAVLTFPRAQIESIEAEHVAVPAPNAKSAPAPSAAAKDFKDLQAQVNALREDLKKLQDEVAKIRGLQAEIGTRTQQIPEPRGDLPGEEPSNLALVNMRWSRAGDNIKVEGAIRNTGGSPGRWTRVTAVVKDLMGTVIGRAETSPAVATPGVSVRDVGWVVPGKDLPINVFVPFGGWSKDSTFSSTEDVARTPRRLPRPNEITVEWKLEVPPKLPSLSGPQGTGQQPQGPPGAPPAGAPEKTK